MPVLYLDLNIYKRPFDDQCQMRIRLETVAITAVFAMIESGQMSARWSFVLAYENSLDPIPERREFAERLSRCCDAAIEPDESIREMAQQMSQSHQIRSRDALHLACAQLSGCDYLVTCDEQLVRQGQRLRTKGLVTVKVINPIDLTREV
jgi:predicted nucleic acid-binding protein